MPSLGPSRRSSSSSFPFFFFFRPSGTYRPLISASRPSFVPDKPVHGMLLKAVLVVCLCTGASAFQLPSQPAVTFGPRHRSSAAAPLPHSPGHLCRSAPAARVPPVHMQQFNLPRGGGGFDPSILIGPAIFAGLFFSGALGWIFNFVIGVQAFVLCTSAPLHLCTAAPLHRSTSAPPPLCTSVHLCAPLCMCASRTSTHTHRLCVPCVLTHPAHLHPPPTHRAPPTAHRALVPARRPGGAPIRRRRQNPRRRGSSRDHQHGFGRAAGGAVSSTCTLQPPLLPTHHQAHVEPLQRNSDATIAWSSLLTASGTLW